MEAGQTAYGIGGGMDFWWFAHPRLRADGRGDSNGL
jgi:hypothetical protein